MSHSKFFWEFFRLRIIFLSFSISIFFLIFYYFVYDTFNVLILIFRYFSLNLNPPLFIFMAAPWNIKFSLNSNFGLVWQKNLFFFFFLLENKRTCSNQPHLVSGFTYFHSNFRSKTLCKLVNTMVITLTLSFVTHISYENTSLSREHLFDLVWLHANIWGKINKQMWPTHCQFKRVYSSTK